MADFNLNVLDTLQVLVIPKMTTTIRDTVVAEIGTIIFNTTTSKLNICKTKAAGSSSWEAVTSA